jgi:membrane protein involved in colicin uptake
VAMGRLLHGTYKKTWAAVARDDSGDLLYLSLDSLILEGEMPTLSAKSTWGGVEWGSGLKSFLMDNLKPQQYWRVHKKDPAKPPEPVGVSDPVRQLQESLEQQQKQQEEHQQKLQLQLQQEQQRSREQLQLQLQQQEQQQKQHQEQQQVQQVKLAHHDEELQEEKRARKKLEAELLEARRVASESAILVAVPYTTAAATSTTTAAAAATATATSSSSSSSYPTLYIYN